MSLSRARLSAAFPIAVAAAATLAAQQAPPTFRTRTELVQVDVVVVDNEGRHVRGLRAEDFQLLDRNNPQAIAAFDEVSHERGDPRVDLASAPPGWRLDVASNTSMQSSRLVVVVIDDLHIYRRRTDRARELARSIVTRLGPDATMALLFTSGKNSTQVTADRSRLLAALETFNGRKAWPRPHSAADGGGGRFDSGPSLDREGNVIERRRSNNAAGLSTEVQEFFENMYQFKTLQDAARMIGAGETRRKAFVMISEGIGKDLTGMFETQGITPCDAKCPSCPCFHDNALRNMMEAMWRASVATYIVDPRGSVESQRLLAEEFPGTDSDDPFRWNNVVRQAQEGLSLIARASGGFAVTDTDDFVSGVERIADDLDHYYLLGFYPADPRGKGFRRLEVKVPARPDLRLRFRRGYQIVDAAAAQRSKNDNPLVALSEGVLPRTDLPMKLGAFPIAGSGETTRVALALEISAPVQALREPDGRLRDRIRFHVLAANLRNSKVASVGGLDGRVTLSPTASAAAAPDTVVYQVMDEIELRPGSYQLRVSATSDKLAKGGSVYLDVDVPDLRSAAVAIGGLAVALVPPRVPVTDLADAGKGIASRSRRPRPQPLPFAPTLEREFVPGDTLRLHAQVLPAGTAPNPVVVEILNGSGAAVWSRTTAVSRGRVDLTFALPEDLAPGAYLLRVGAPRENLPANGSVGFVVR